MRLKLFEPTEASPNAEGRRKASFNAYFATAPLPQKCRVVSFSGTPFIRVGGFFIWCGNTRKNSLRARNQSFTIAKPEKIAFYAYAAGFSPQSLTTLRGPLLPAQADFLLGAHKCIKAGFFCKKTAQKSIEIYEKLC